MPSWKVHLIFDLILVSVILITLYNWGMIVNPLLIVFLVIFNILATIFPDIDTPKSKLRNYFSWILGLLVTGYLIINFSIGSILSAIATFIFVYLVLRFFPTRHRGITHNLWFSLLFSLGLNSILWLMFRFSSFEFGIYYLIIFWGYLSHLTLDNLV